VADLTAEEALELAGGLDLLLVTATATETAAVSAALAPLPGAEDVARTHVGNHTYRLGMFGPHRSVHMQCVMGTRDAGSAMTATEEAVRLWAPRAVLMMGIAWGNPHVKKLGLGDVLVASSVRDFENVRVGAKNKFRSPETQAGPKLLDRFNNVDDWHLTLPDGRVSIRRAGLMLSGDKLIAKARFRDDLLKEFDNALGGDMESYGVAQACRALQVEWLVVKGVCDKGNEFKDDKWQDTAAAASVSLCLAAMRNPSSLDGLASSVHNDHLASMQDPGSTSAWFDSPVFVDAVARPQLSARLGSALREHPVVVLGGLPGSGKTYLMSSYVAISLSDQTYGRVLWYDPAEGESLDNLLALLGANVALGGLSAASRCKALLALLRNQNALLVIDNYQRVDQSTYSLLVEMFSGAGLPCRLVLLSQTYVTLPTASRDPFQLPVTGFSIDETRAFLKGRGLGRSANHLVGDLVAKTDGLPFAVSLFAVLVREFGHNPTELLAGTMESDTRIREWFHNLESYAQGFGLRSLPKLDLRRRLQWQQRLHDRLERLHAGSHEHVHPARDRHHHAARLPHQRYGHRTRRNIAASQVIQNLNKEVMPKTYQERNQSVTTPFL
jgi:nucleoside phosphorylase